MAKIKGEKHKKSVKIDGHRPQDDTQKRYKRTPERYTNFDGEPVE